MFKVNSELICSNVAAAGERPTDDSSGTGRVYGFSFVREPISHFVSAYAEIVNRALTWERPSYMACARCYSFMEHLDAPADAALAFVHDMVQGCVASPCCTNTSGVWWGSDLHVLPQVSFLRNMEPQANALAPLQLVGRLEHMDADWARIGRTLHGWPPMNSSMPIWTSASEGECGTHSRGCEPRSTRHKKAMRRLLWGNSLVRVAICRILLPDYACFRHLYELPADCARAIGPKALQLSCPAALRRFISS
jgi:hypothetical protein